MKLQGETLDILKIEEMKNKFTLKDIEVNQKLQEQIHMNLVADNNAKNYS
jgi:hypothetical protein